MHISLEGMRGGGMVGGLFAMFVPPRGVSHDDGSARRSHTGLYPRVEIDFARRTVISQFAVLHRLIERSAGALRIAGSIADIETARENGEISVVPHLEGADAISRSLDELEVFVAAGLRSLGIVWSRHNRFGHGVPIYGEGTPDTAGGLTVAGKRLVRRCRDLDLMIDLSHITEAGFWDVARLYDGPLVASHSNAWELCHSPRNLTDRQLDAIARSDGFVGVNFGTIFIRKDRAPQRDTPLRELVAHIRRIVEAVGIDRVGFGSDFDGTVIPDGIGSAWGLPALLSALSEEGFTPEEVRKIAAENWLSLLRRVWGAAR